MKRYFLIQFEVLINGGGSIKQNVGYISKTFPSHVQVEEDAHSAIGGAVPKEDYRVSTTVIHEFKSGEDFYSYFDGEAMGEYIKEILT